MFVLALSLYNTWNRGVFLLCKITNLLIYSINNSIGEDSNISTSELNKIKEHIYVVNFNDQNDTKLFNMEMPTV